MAVCGLGVRTPTDNSGTERNFWPTLQRNIRADRGTLEAFFWYQGEDNQFNPTTPQQLYLEWLTTLVDDIRREIFEAHRKRWGPEGSPTAKFETRADVPVIIVELGAWISSGRVKGSDQPGDIIRAQREYVSTV